MRRWGKRCAHVDGKGQQCRNFCDRGYRLCARHAALVCRKLREQERLDLEAHHLTGATA